MKQSNYTLLALIIILLSINAKGNEFHKEFSLRGNWNFKIGDNPDWSKINFDDTDWKKIYVPSPWEDEGYQGYDGYAWYRRVVEIPSTFKDRVLTLELGCIDDVDEVYFNGVKIGQSGSFPPYYSTAYNSQRLYEIPLNIIHFDKTNLIAVRVYDSQLEGGIVKGEIRIGASAIAIVPDINMNGTWNFNTGMNINDSRMQNIIVPGRWENQGFYDYDGYAVYSRTINIHANFIKERMVFLAGRIDDYDQLYINGKIIGQTGQFESRENSDKSNEFRNYFIPAGVLKPGDNKVEIKVYDKGGEGGILEGTVGFISQDNFIKYWKMKRIK